MIFEKKKNIKCGFRFSLQRLPESFLILRKIQQYITNEHYAVM